MLFRPGSPFLCRVTDGDGGFEGGAASDDDVGASSGRVAVDLSHLGLVPVGAPAGFTIRVAGGDDAELAVSVQGE